MEQLTLRSPTVSPSQYLVLISIGLSVGVPMSVDSVGLMLVAAPPFGPKMPVGRSRRDHGFRGVAAEVRGLVIGPTGCIRGLDGQLDCAGGGGRQVSAAAAC